MGVTATHGLLPSSCPTSDPSVYSTTVDLYGGSQGFVLIVTALFLIPQSMYPIDLSKLA